MSADSPQIDPAMLELFQAEMDTHIPVLNEGLLALEKGQAGAQEIEAMMRAAHSIKGAARIVGIEPAVRVSHVMEDCFTAAKNGQIALSSEAVDTLLEGVDALQRICSPASGDPLTESSLAGLIQALTTLKSGQIPVKTAHAPQENVEAVETRSLVAATVHRDEPSVTLPAVFDERTSESLRRELLDTLSLGPARIELDFGQVAELSACALALLVSFANEAAGVRLAPVIESRGLRPAVDCVLQTAGLGAILGRAKG